MKRLAFFALLVLSVALVARAQETTPPPDPDRYTDLREITNARGFPQLGYPSAPISVIIYGAFDDVQSGVFYGAGFPALLERARTGEIVLVYVPMAGRGTIPTGRGAARAAICAGEQDAFWEFHDLLFTWQSTFGADAFSGARLIDGANNLPISDLLFTWQSTFGADAFSGARLIDGANNLPISRPLWDACMLSDRPDAVLLEGEATAASEPLFAITPYITINGVPTLPDADSLTASIEFEVTRNVATFEAALDTSAEPALDGTPDPEATEPVVITLEPLMGASITPPLIIGLPQGWAYGYDVLVLQDVDAIRNIPIAVYMGPVTGGTGTIILVWGFPNLIPSLTENGIAEPNLWADGLRLLRLAVIEQGCNIGTDLRRDYSIGGLASVGTSFAAVGCPELADTRGWFAGLQQFARGWFAGLQQFGLNFVFYTYVEPISAMDASAPDELQRILDTVRFVVPPTATPTLLTPTPAP